MLMMTRINRCVPGAHKMVGTRVEIPGILGAADSRGPRGVV